MGRGHSGSTILDIILGNSAEIESVGELVSGLSREGRGEICACGEPMQDCTHWQRVRLAFAEIARDRLDELQDWHDATRALVAHAHIRNLPRTLLARADAVELRSLGQASMAIADAIARASGKPHVVDSSKEPTRALMLLRFCPDARVIHLVRDPRRMMASHYWRFKKWGGYFKFLRHSYHAPPLLVPVMLLDAVAWTVGSLIAELARRFAPDRVLKLRYEDLCDSPAAALARIAEAFAISLDDVAARIERGEPLAIGHNVGGNHIRNEGTVVFSPGKGKERVVPRWLDYLTLACCWPLMLAYGYSLRSPKLPQAASVEAKSAGH
jgi:hypothetical protein